MVRCEAQSGEAVDRWDELAWCMLKKKADESSSRISRPRYSRRLRLSIMWWSTAYTSGARCVWLRSMQSERLHPPPGG